MPPDEFEIPWQERVLSVTASFGDLSVDVHTTHIPPGSSNGWIKIETLEGIYQRLSKPSTRHQILCGDFNTPRHESETGEVISFAFRVNKAGNYTLKRNRGERWDAGERGILLDLARHDLPDVFRLLHGYQKKGYSWYPHMKWVPRGLRFDHVFASPKLDPQSCEYLEDFRSRGISDHAPIEAVFRLEA
jgi:exonuclease III